MGESRSVSSTRSSNGNENDDHHENTRDDDADGGEAEVDLGQKLLKHRTHFSVQPSSSNNADDFSRKNYHHYHKHHEGYLGDSPQAAKRLTHYDTDGVLDGAHENRRGSNTSGKNSSGTNGYEDKKRNINDNKSNNNLKPKITSNAASADQSIADADASTSHGNNGGSPSVFRPDVYQDLFALNSATAFQTVPINAVSASKENNDFANYNGTNIGLSPYSEQQDRPSPVYSVFVLVVVACVVFLFLVAIIGFFVVTSSITRTAQYFVPKRIRVWIVGRSQDELLRNSGLGRDREDEDADADEEEEEEFYGNSYCDEFDDHDDCSGSSNRNERSVWNDVGDSTSFPQHDVSQSQCSRESLQQQ
jgi:hypothetical protein